MCVFKNTDQNNICVSIIIKAKTEKNVEKNGWPPKKGIFEFWKKNCKKMYSHFSFVLALKTIDPQMLFWSVLTAKNGQNSAFDDQ